MKRFFIAFLKTVGVVFVLGILGEYLFGLALKPIALPEPQLNLTSAVVIAVCWVSAVLIFIGLLKKASPDELWIALPVLLVGAIYVTSTAYYELTYKSTWCSKMESHIKTDEERRILYSSKVWERTCTSASKDDSFTAKMKLLRVVGPAIAYISGFLLIVIACRYWNEASLRLWQHMCIFAVQAALFKLAFFASSLSFILQTILIVLTNMAGRISELTGMYGTGTAILIYSGLYVLCITRLGRYFYGYDVIEKQRVV